MQALYQELIMDHNKSPRNKGDLPGHNHAADGFNPLCGDAVRLELLVTDGVIEDVRFSGHGCAIDTASASMLTQAIKGKHVDDVRVLREAFLHLVLRDSDEAPAEDELGKLMVFEGVGAFPARVKCATLPWRTLEAALSGGGEVSTE